MLCSSCVNVLAKDPASSLAGLLEEVTVDVFVEVLHQDVVSDIDVETPLKVAVLVVSLLVVPLPVAVLNVLVALV